MTSNNAKEKLARELAYADNRRPRENLLGQLNLKLAKSHIRDDEEIKQTLLPHHQQRQDRFSNFFRPKNDFVGNSTRSFNIHRRLSDDGSADGFAHLNDDDELNENTNWFIENLLNDETTMGL